jgi:hypothetical protein
MKLRGKLHRNCEINYIVFLNKFRCINIHCGSVGWGFGDVGESLLIISYSVIVICYQLLVEKKTGLRAQG